MSERNLSERNNNISSSSTGTAVSMNSLRRGLTLPLHEMAIPIYTSPSREDVETGGRVLFQHFIQEELAHQQIPEEVLDLENPLPDAFGDVSQEMHSNSAVRRRPESPDAISTPEGFKNSKFHLVGGNLRAIADKFGKSHERTLVRQQADEVDLNDINYDTFRHFLSSLFKNGIDKYCIVALFFFCSDVLIRCIKNNLHRLGNKLFFWALDFLLENVCNWVHDHGGWERVFADFYDMALKGFSLVALGVFIVCGIIWIKNNK